MNVIEKLDTTNKE